jgi:hypothetical protein
MKVSRANEAKKMGKNYTTEKAYLRQAVITVIVMYHHHHHHHTT